MFAKFPLALTLFLSSLTFALTGCGLDSSVDDYRRAKVGQELAKYQAIEGTYAGRLNSNRDGALGTLVIKLRADVDNIDSSDRLSSEQRAVIRGELTFMHDSDPSRRTTLTFNDGYYNDSDGVFRATTLVTQSSGTQTRLDLYGRIRLGVFDGRIEITGYSEDGGNFRVVQGASVIEEPGSSPDIRPRPVIDQRLVSRARFSSNGRIETVRARISAHEASNEEDFLLLFRPFRTVDIVLNIEPGLVFFSPNGKWDLRAGTLRAKLTTPSGHGSIELFCREHLLENGVKGWNCHADGVHSSLFDGIFEPENLARD